MRSPLFYLLLPLAWSYDAATRFRNYLFDRGFKREHTFPLPVITVGNLAVGGTGKTPHTEYLLRLLHEKHNMAMLSRGYRRRTHGYIRATATATAEDIGDEPLQIARKFPNVTVAVDANRCEGIERLMKQRDPKIDALVLDDAFQHRHVRAGLNILLTDYSRLYIDDYLLPAGRLREARGGSGRADIIIVTKCPPTLEADEFEGIARRLRLAREQRLFATTYDYATPSPSFRRPEPRTPKHRIRRRRPVPRYLSSPVLPTPRH